VQRAERKGAGEPPSPLLLDKGTLSGMIRLKRPHSHLVSLQPLSPIMKVGWKSQVTHRIRWLETLSPPKQSQVGWGFEQPDVVKDAPAHGMGVGLDDL